MGFRENLKAAIIHILSCCDEETQAETRSMVIGSPYNFRHVNGANTIVDSSVQEKSPHTFGNTSTSIEAFLISRRIGLSASTASVQNSLKQHARNLSNSIRCSVYSTAGVGEDGKTGGQSEEQLVVVQSIETEQEMKADIHDPGNQHDLARVNDQDEDFEDVESWVSDVTHEQEHEEVDMDNLDDDDEEEEEEVETPVEIAKAISMRRFGSTDLLGEGTSSERKS